MSPLSSNAHLNTSKPIPPKGYLAFPAGLNKTPYQRLKFALEQELAEAAAADIRSQTQLAESARLAAHAEAERERAWSERQCLDTARRRACEAREREQALIGEKSWVRSGGVLRDLDGRRDPTRTEEIRNLIKEEDERLAALARWNAYEAAWTKLLASDDQVTFDSMPWPVMHPPPSTEALNITTIAAFLFDSLRFNTIKVTKKERLRSSLLRWHPDKLSGVLSRVRREELDQVKNGIDSVVISLMCLQDKLNVHKISSQLSCV